jgi:hypothetical protein
VLLIASLEQDRSTSYSLVVANKRRKLATQGPATWLGEADLREFLRALREHTARAVRSREAAIASLVADGIYTKSGRLRKPFR